MADNQLDEEELLRSPMGESYSDDHLTCKQLESEEEEEEENTVDITVVNVDITAVNSENCIDAVNVAVNEEDDNQQVIEGVSTVGDCDATMLTAGKKGEHVGQSTPLILNGQFRSSTGIDEGLVTSTPCTEPKRGRRNRLESVGGASTYKPPARSILEKWRPSVLVDHYEKVHTAHNTGMENISAIENALKPINADDGNNDDRNNDNANANDNKSEFEAAFNKLYTTLVSGACKSQAAANANANANEQVQSTPQIDSNVSKLELYRSSIAEQSKCDDEKFNEIISEISMSNRSFITIDETGTFSDRHLSTISEDTSEYGSDNDNDETLVNMADYHKVQLENVINWQEKEEPEASCNVRLDNNIDKMEDNCERETELTTTIQVPVINGSNSIMYLNSRELTLDEEEDLLNSDNEDAISLVCSDIGEVTSAGSAVSVETSNKGRDPDPAATTTDDDQLKADSGNEQIKRLESETDEFATLMSNNAVTVLGPTPVLLDDRNLPFVSSDPKENEDNNDPQWEHLRRLKNDKERYKALRERWHSVVIPNPNLDLTSQMFRQKKALQAKSTSCVNGQPTDNPPDNCRKRGHPQTDAQYYDEGPPKKKRKCTTLFEESIQQLLKKWEFKRLCLHHEMNDRFAELAYHQEEAVFKVHTMRCNALMRRKFMNELHAFQVQEVQTLRQEYKQKIGQAEREVDEYVDALNAASEEVNTFHRFYQDLDTVNTKSGSSSMYLTETQFQELVETENMLDLYSKFYN